MKSLYILTGIFLIAFTSANAQLTNDKTANKIIDDVCEGRLFTKYETAAEFKDGQSAFEDTLFERLKTKPGFNQKGTVKYKMILTKESQIIDVVKLEGDISKENDNNIKQAIISSGNMWVPAKQNSYMVCAYVGLELTFSRNKITASIFKPTRNIF